MRLIPPARRRLVGASKQQGICRAFEIGSKIRQILRGAIKTTNEKADLYSSRKSKIPRFVHISKSKVVLDP